MLARLRHMFGWLIGVFRSRKDLVLEKVALRQQLLAFERSLTHPHRVRDT